ncbi:MAG: TerC family protein, partial [Candidatus Omnitrophica bacterium]|nr:TerC family protein [Candidatus Omnitrophota bacterium]
FKLFFDDEKEIHPEHNPIVKFFRRLMPVTANYEGENFFVKRDGRWWATPLFVVVLVIETTDVIFAIDSIPAVLSISSDPFIIYTSNIFAILGLRSLFFALSSVMKLFHYLHYGLGAILVFVGVKMGISHFFHIPINVSLSIIGGILMFSVILSIIIGKKKHEI